MPESQIKVKINPDVTPAGSDLSIVNAARRSFNTRSNWDGSGKLKEKDKRLLEFLARGMTAKDFDDFILKVGEKGLYWLYHSDLNMKKDLLEALWQWRNTPTHDTPFNHTFISFEVQAPIFVRAQLVKHEYLILSEFSRRYITDNVEFYEPDYWRKAAPNKKQGSLDEPVESVRFQDYGENYKSKINLAYSAKYSNDVMFYDSLVKGGVAPEQARMILPQSLMTEWTWSGTLGAFAKMCQLRLHPEAQYEARLVAQQVYDYLKIYYPVGAKALVEGV